MSGRVIPFLTYEDVGTAMDWLVDAFGFTVGERITDDEGQVIHGVIAVGDEPIFLGGAGPDYRNPRRHADECEQARRWLATPWVIDGVLVYVEDLQTHFENAKAAGATILSEPEDDFPGPRYRAADLEGHRWMFMQGT